MVYGIGFRIRMLISIQSTGRSVLSCRSRMLSYTSTICLHSGNGSGSNFPGQKKGHREHQQSLCGSAAYSAFKAKHLSYWRISNATCKCSKKRFDLENHIDREPMAPSRRSSKCLARDWGGMAKLPVSNFSISAFSSSCGLPHLFDILYL